MSNDRMKRTFEYDVADAALLSHALMIGANTAMMCGHPQAQARLKQYDALLKQVMPEIAKVFEGEQWCEMGLALNTATTFKVSAEAPSWNKWGGTGYIVVTIGDRVWRTRDSGFQDEAPQFQQVFDYLTELAPMDCEGEKSFKRVSAW